MIQRASALACTALLALALALLASPSSAVTRVAKPELGRSFVVSLVSGTVLVKPRGSARSTRLTERRTIPVGSTVNATRGKVRLIGAVKRSGGRQAGVFYSGAFRATQARRNRAIIDLQLVGGSFADCGKETAARAAGRLRLGRRLLGNARGNFRTRGQHSAATVRGTKWLTEDRCSSTAVESRSGEVVATSGAQSFVLEDGDVFESACTPAGVPPPDADYCLATLSDKADNIFAFGLGTEVHQGDYTLCVSPPTGEPICKLYPIGEPEQAGSDFRIAAAGCNPDRGAGTYTVSWAVAGQFLGALPFRVTNPDPPGQGICPISSEELAQP